MATLQNKQSASVSEIEEVLDSVAERFKMFQSFDVTTTAPYDHHFIMTNPPVDRQFSWGLSKPKGDRKSERRERVEKEWEILKVNLPNSVFVRAYEDRWDLMRVVIIALKGTPCSYSLFFFDIFFQKDYPSKPPLIFHNPDYGSPNLNTNFLSSYNNTSVMDCMASRRNAKFKWDPQTSNVLQVLGFIQWSFLTSTRIFANDLKKNFFLSQKAMLRVLKAPPKGFEDFVCGYVRSYSHEILMQFKARCDLSKCQVMTKLFFELVDVFEANGSYCQHLVSGVKRESHPLKDQYSTRNGPTSSSWNSRTYDGSPSKPNSFNHWSENHNSWQLQW